MSMKRKVRGIFVLQVFCVLWIGGSNLFFHILTYLLTYFMVQSRSWEANWFAAIQEIPRISLNLKVHYRTHKRPPPVYPGPA